MDLLGLGYMVGYDFPSWLRHLAIWGSVGFEAIIPVLLIFKPTRLLGIGVGILFHSLLALHPHDGIYSFSTLLLALFMLFEPERILSAFNEQMRKVRQRWPRIARNPEVLGVLLVLLFCTIILLEFRVTGKMPVYRAGFLLWFVAAISASLLWWRALTRKEPTDASI